MPVPSFSLSSSILETQVVSTMELHTFAPSAIYRRILKKGVLTSVGSPFIDLSNVLERRRFGLFYFGTAAAQGS